MTRNFVGLIALLMAMAGPLASSAEAADSEGNGARVEQAWARASIGTSRPAAAYVTVVNESDRAVTVTGASSPVAEKAEVHKTVKDGTTMKMVPAGPIEIPAGGRIEMKPGGYHIMLMNLKQAIGKGESLDLTLRFADGAQLNVIASVMGPGAMGPAK